MKNIRVRGHQTKNIYKYMYIQKGILDTIFIAIGFYILYFFVLLLLMFHLKGKDKRTKAKKKNQNQKTIKISLGKYNSHYIKRQG